MSKKLLINLSRDGNILHYSYFLTSASSIETLHKNALGKSEAKAILFFALYLSWIQFRYVIKHIDFLLLRDMIVWFLFSRPAEPKEGEKPKLWRRIWQISHKFTGRLSLLLALINISLGLFVSLAHKAIWITWFVYIGVVVVAYIVAEIYSRKQAEGKIDLTHVAHPMEARSWTYLEPYKNLFQILYNSLHSI